LVTLGTVVGLTMLGAIAGYQLRGAWVDKSANLIAAVVLLIIGVLVACSII
jgi:nickel/cobalt transporter (NicO) family protein